MTTILRCDCKDEFQDKEYGKGMRVHNVGGKGKEKLAYCTCCTVSRRILRMQLPEAQKPDARNPFGITYFGLWGTLKSSAPKKL